MIVMLPPAHVVRVFVGGPDMGGQHTLTMRSNGMGSSLLLGCFSESSTRFRWAAAGGMVRIGLVGRRKASNGTPSHYISPSNAYVVRRVKAGEFLVPIEAIRSFDNEVQHSGFDKAHPGRWPFLRRLEAASHIDANRPLVLKPRRAF